MTTQTFKLVLVVSPGQLDACSAELFAAGAGGVEEQDGPSGTTLVCYGDRADLERLAAAARDAARDGSFESSIEPIDDSWQTEWTRYLKQERLTQRLVIQPEFDDTPPPPGMRGIRYQPLMAFGVGSHATTQLAAQAVEDWCLEHPAARVLDVGTGNGVLCFVALLSGAHAALGIDVDPVAVDAARANARLNELDVEFDTAPAEQLAEQHDLVVANVELPALAGLLPELCRLAKLSVVISGFASDRAPELERRAIELGFVAGERCERDGWGLWRLERREP